MLNVEAAQKSTSLSRNDYPDSPTQNTNTGEIRPQPCRTRTGATTANSDTTLIQDARLRAAIHGRSCLAVESGDHLDRQLIVGQFRRGRVHRVCDDGAGEPQAEPG